MRTHGWRYFVSVGSRLVPAGTYLYDLARDPGELSNLAGKGRREEARAARHARLAGCAAPARRDAGAAHAEEAAALRALGYQ